MYFTLTEEYEFDIVYQPGKTNFVADALSRRPSRKLGKHYHINAATKKRHESNESRESENGPAKRRQKAARDRPKRGPQSGESTDEIDLDGDHGTNNHEQNPAKIPRIFTFKNSFVAVRNAGKTFWLCQLEQDAFNL